MVKSYIIESVAFSASLKLYVLMFLSIDPDKSWFLFTIQYNNNITNLIESRLEIRRDDDIWRSSE